MKTEEEINEYIEYLEDNSMRINNKENTEMNYRAIKILKWVLNEKQS